MTTSIPDVDGIDWPDSWNEPSVDGGPGAGKPKRKSRRQPRPVDGNIELFGAIKLAHLAKPAFVGRFRWCKELGWLGHNGSKWTTDGPSPLAALVSVIKDYTRELLDDRPALTADDCKELGGFSSGNCQSHALKILAQDEGIRTNYRLFDAAPPDGQPWTLPCANGVTIELHADGSSTVRPTTPADMNTKTACTYDPDAKAPTIARAFKDYQPDENVRRFLLQMWCRGLSGIGAENFFAFIGEGGGNGKGSTWDALSAVGGDYAVGLPVGVVIKQRGDNMETYRSQLAALRGARLVFCEEPDEGSAYDMGIVKALTGGGTMHGRAMGMDGVEFPANWVFMLAANSRPTWKADGAMTRRYVEVAWDFSIEKAALGGIREDFKKRLKVEASGFLNAILAQWTGLEKPPMPEVVRNQTLKGSQAASPLADFARDALRPEQGGRVKAADLFGAYVKWAVEAGVRLPLTATKFGMEVVRFGYPKTKVHGVTVYHGLVVNGAYLS